MTTKSKLHNATDQEKQAYFIAIILAHPEKRHRLLQDITEEEKEEYYSWVKNGYRFV